MIRKQMNKFSPFIFLIFRYNFCFPISIPPQIHDPNTTALGNFGEEKEKNTALGKPLT